VRTIALFHEISLMAATHAGPWTFLDPNSIEANPFGSTSLGRIKIRFGIAPGNYDDEDPGILVSSITPGASAEKAGIQAGDLLLRWNGVKILDIREWMGMLAEHDPGDVVKVGVVRDGKEITIDVELFAKPTGDNK
jgi:S1-C subfamily serine protease